MNISLGATGLELSYFLDHFNILACQIRHGSSDRTSSRATGSSHYNLSQRLLCSPCRRKKENHPGWPPQAQYASPSHRLPSRPVISNVEFIFLPFACSTQVDFLPPPRPPRPPPFQAAENLKPRKTDPVVLCWLRRRAAASSLGLHAPRLSGPESVNPHPTENENPKGAKPI